MNDTTTVAVKFRERAVTHAAQDALGVTVYVRDVPQPIRVDYAGLSDAVRVAGLAYGIEVKLTRAAALSRDLKTGKSASAQDKWDAIRKCADALMAGNWNVPSSGFGGGLSSDTRALIEALSAAFDADPEDVEVQVKSMSAADRDALRVDPEVKPHLDAVYAARAKAAGADVKGMIERLKKVGVAI